MKGFVKDITRADAEADNEHFDGKTTEIEIGIWHKVRFPPSGPCG